DVSDRTVPSHRPGQRATEATQMRHGEPIRVAQPDRLSQRGGSLLIESGQQRRVVARRNWIVRLGRDVADVRERHRAERIDTSRSAARVVVLPDPAGPTNTSKHRAEVATAYTAAAWPSSSP